MFHYTVESDKTIQEAILAIEEALKEEKFGVLWKLNMQDKLKEKGVDLDKEVVILEVCNPKEAKKVLSISSLVSYFLPCKIAVYKERNKTKIGMLKPTELMNLVQDERLVEIAGNIESRLAGCIEKAK